MISAPPLYELASELYRGCGRFPFHFARGKLKHDPVMCDLLTLDCLRRTDASESRLLDLGCGQALLFATLDAAARINRDAAHPAALPAMPPIAYAKGYDAAPRNVRWAHQMLANRAQPQLAAEITVADVRTVDLPACDIVVAIDLLHYMPYRDQEGLLRKIAAALAPGGRLLMRVADAAQTRPSRVSRWIDRAAAGLRGQGWQALWMRSIDEWLTLLSQLGFTARSIKTYRSPWAVNVLVCGDKLD